MKREKGRKQRTNEKRRTATTKQRKRTEKGGRRRRGMTREPEDVTRVGNVTPLNSRHLGTEERLHKTLLSSHCCQPPSSRLSLLSFSLLFFLSPSLSLSHAHNSHHHRLHRSSLISLISISFAYAFVYKQVNLVSNYKL